jgi:hypothetical protein
VLVFAIADTLARKWQANFRFDWLWLFLLAVVAIGCFEMFAHLAPIAKGVLYADWQSSVDVALLVGYIAVFMTILIVFAIARGRQHQERFLDYRALAEAMRVAVFWKLNGIGSIADAYPIKLPRELAWVKACLLACELLDTAEYPSLPPLDARRYGWTRNLWIGGQCAFFRSRSSMHLHTAERRENISLAILFFAILLAVVLLGLEWYAPALVQREEWRHNLFLFFIGILPGVAAAFVGHAEQLAFKAQSRQFDRMREVFERALELLPPETPAAPVSPLIRDVFRELGSEAMREHAEWVAIYRQRPIRVPQG